LGRECDLPPRLINLVALCAAECTNCYHPCTKDSTFKNLLEAVYRIRNGGLAARPSAMAVNGARTGRLTESDLRGDIGIPWSLIIVLISRKSPRNSTVRYLVPLCCYDLTRALYSCTLLVLVGALSNFNWPLRKSCSACQHPTKTAACARCLLRLMCKREVSRSASSLEHSCIHILPFNLLPQTQALLYFAMSGSDKHVIEMVDMGAVAQQQQAAGSETPGRRKLVHGLFEFAT